MFATWSRIATGAIVLLVCSPPLILSAQANSLTRRVDRLLGSPAFGHTIWGVMVTDERGRTLYQRNADLLFVPASNTKLVVAAAATALLPPDFRTVTSVYGSGPLDDGVLHGDLVVYGRGDPMFSERCYGVDTLAAGACETMWTRIDALADSLVERGLRHVSGALVGDGSYFDDEVTHPSWETYDLNWWYAAPVTALGFNDNSVNVTWGPGPTIDAPAEVSFEPDLGAFRFENRTRTVTTDRSRTIDFYREPGQMVIWAEGTVPIDDRGKTEYFALPDPNLYFAQALRAALARNGVSVAGPTRSTTDSLSFQRCRAAPALVTIGSRPLGDLLFPILNSSQNWFAEMLVKQLGRQLGGAGTWEAGLEVERRFLTDSVGIDSTAFSLRDGSGLSSGNLISPRAIVQLLQYMLHHPNRAPFRDALPRSGEPGSLSNRFLGTAVEGMVVAKTGSISRVHTLSGYLEQPGERVLIFSILANNSPKPYAELAAQVDAIVGALVR